MSEQRLAILGGEPAFDAPLHVGCPNVLDPERVVERIRGILDRRWLTNDGPVVREFEEEVRRLADVRHCVAVCNATVGLELVIDALGMRDEVVVPSFTFVATAHAVARQGMAPIFADVCEARHLLDPGSVEEALSDRTTGIVATHLWGGVCDVDGLAALARRRGLRLVFDAAHAFGVRRAGVPVGGFGDAEVFSFHATKFVNSFEGGAVVTNDGALAERLRRARNFGFAGYDAVEAIGGNGKMTEVCAAMGLSSLEGLDVIVGANRRNFEAYREGLGGIPGLRLIEPAADEVGNYQHVIIEVNEEACGIGRNLLARTLWAENIRVRRYFYPGCHRMAAYVERPASVRTSLARTERIASRVLAFPTGLSVTPESARRVAALVRLAFLDAQAIREAAADEDDWTRAHARANGGAGR